MAKFPLSQVNVFSNNPLLGNPVAVVHNANNLNDEDMAAFARWTNLSETTFLLTPTHPAADYRLRIFTPEGELPFAGHPTLGSCHAWLEKGGLPKGDAIIQECGVGLVSIKHHKGRLAFAAPPLRRTGPMAERDLKTLCEGLGISFDDIVDHQWIDNGPGWCGLLLKQPQTLRQLTPNYQTLCEFNVGVAALTPDDQHDLEVRAFVPSLGVPEDPVTGSLNAGFAQWLLSAGYITAPYTARQGNALHRAGLIYIEEDADNIWVAGQAVTTIDGQLTLG